MSASVCRWAAALLLLGLSLTTPEGVAGQLSKPIALDRQIDVRSNKFLQRRADKDDAVPTANDEVEVSGQCSANLALKWMTEVGSSIYATPLIHDLFSDGHKDIIVPSFVHYLEVVDGSNGGKAAQDSWPAFHSSTVHTSPLTYDFDFDNVQDILLATYDGEVLVFKDTGEQLAEKLVVPRLRVHKDWYRGLAADFIDHSHPDVGAAPSAAPGRAHEAAQFQAGENDGSVRRRALLEAAERTSAAQDTGSISLEESQKQQSAENEGSLTNEATATFSELFGQADGDKAASTNGEQEVGNPHEEATKQVEQMAGVEDISWDSLPVDPDGLGGISDWHDKYASNYGDYVVEPGLGSLQDHAWADEMYFAAPHKTDAEWVYIDSHILCTPAIGDLDGDGRDELVVAASYFFDREYYDAPANKAELGKDIDTAKYIAGGIVVFDLRSRAIKWTQHLDLSTDHTQFRAYIYSAPTLVDLDNDGKLDILVGTSMGFLYVLDHTGHTREGWPLQMGEIQAQVAVADLRGNGQPVILAVDARGNVAAFDADANELWERHLGTLIAQAATFADVNGDGQLEVLLGSTSGAMYALEPTSGQDIPNFPFYTQGRIMSPILPTRLRAGIALQLVVPSYDGHLYAVDGISGCADVVDIGETAYAMVLADDLDGNGRLDLLLASMNGNLYAFQTAAPADPLATWPAQVASASGFTSRLEWLSIAATAFSRQPRDVRGQSLHIRFQITDPRARGGNSTLGPYTVTASLQGVGAKEMGAGDQPVIGLTTTLTQAGTYSIQLPCPRTRSTATVVLEVRDAFGRAASDSFSLSFHMHFHRLLKWLLVAPFTLASLAILAQQSGSPGVGLPSFQ